MGNKPSGVARDGVEEAGIAKGRNSAPTLSTMDIIFATIARLNPAHHSATKPGSDDTAPIPCEPPHLADRSAYPVIMCSTRFDSLSETSSFISDYMDRLPFPPVEDAVSETVESLPLVSTHGIVSESVVKPGIDDAKALFDQLGSQDKTKLVQDYLKSCDNHAWFDTLATAEIRDLRFDVLGNLPAELVHRVGDYLEPEDIVRSIAVSRKWLELLSNSKFCGSQLASHFEVKTAQVTSNVSTPQTFLGLTRRYHSQKMGRPFARAEFPMPVSVEGVPLDFHRCLFDFSGGRLAFIEYSGSILRALHLIFLSTMFSIVLHDFSSDSFERINDMKMSGRLIAMLSAFGHCLIMDLGTPAIRARLRKVILPSNDYEGLVVVGDKVMVLFKNLVCIWTTSSTTLRTFKVNAGFSSLDSTVWAMLHPTVEVFLVAKWEWCYDFRGSYLGDLITTAYSSRTGKVISTMRAAMNIPVYRLGHNTEFFYQSCYKDSVRHMSLFGIIANKGSTLAQGLVHYLIEHNFQQNKVYIKTLNTRGFQDLTGKCPADFIASYIPGGTLSLIHPIEPFSHHNYDVNEENFNHAIRIPTYHFSDNSGQLGNEDDVLQLRQAFANDKWHVILCERAVQVFCYHEGIHMTILDYGYLQEMTQRWLNRSANRKHQRDVLALVERLRRPRQFLLDA